MSRNLLFFVVMSVLTAFPAFAQEASAPSAGAAIMQQLLLFVPLILIFYFLIIRPQSQQRKQHQAMIDAVRRGDTIVTSGGLIGKVTKVADQELTVELADNVRVRIVRRMVSDVRSKGTLVPANDTKPT